MEFALKLDSAMRKLAEAKAIHGTGCECWKCQRIDTVATVLDGLLTDEMVFLAANEPEKIYELLR